MKLLEMSDSQILEIAEPILKDIVTGSNNKDWEQFSMVLWKQTSSASKDEYLEKLYLQEIDGEIKQAGTWIE